ncbi:protein argonaute-2-like isoform 1-T2 [Cochliomyia hominivorax]
MPNEAYHYDVTITPDRPKKFLRPVFEQSRLEMFPNVIWAFDGLQLDVNWKYVPDSSNRMKEFSVQIKETECCVVDMSSLRTTFKFDDLKWEYEKREIKAEFMIRNPMYFI